MLVASSCRRSRRKFRCLTRTLSFLTHDEVVARNRSVNALVSVAPEIDHLGPQDISLPLAGVSMSVKDNICTRDMPTTCSSKMLDQFRSPFDATVVELLRSAGARLVGKTNCDEFGMGSLNVHTSHGPVINPHQPSSSTASWEDRERRSAGGSSGGSAAAVAAGLSDVALGTDTGGSVRLPASYCGVVGLKPSYGILSRWGVVSYADSLDCVGLLGRDVMSVSNTFDVLSQYDAKDPSAAAPDVRQRASDACSTRQNWTDNLEGLRVGIPLEYFPTELATNVLGPFRRVVDALKSLGAIVVPVSMPATPYALSAYYVIASAEASSNLARYDGIQYGLRVEPPPGSDLTKTANVYAHSRSQGFGAEVRKRILLGTYALTADAFDNYFLQAQRLRQFVHQDFDNAFRIANPLKSPSASPEPRQDGVDILLHPSAIRTAPPLPSPSEEPEADEASSLSSYVQDVLTVPASLAGVPAISVPAGEADDGWPVGVSLVSQWGFDKLVLGVARTLEQHIGSTK